MIILVVVIVTVINNVVLINAKIPSPSMEKTIMTGDRIFGFRLAYGINIDFFGHNYTKKFRDPERFDIVIFKYPDDERKLYIKRVIGLPGETVQIMNETVYIDGVPLEEESLAHVSLSGLADEPVVLGENEYFVLGDNRDSSEDSRFANIGNVKRGQIQGKVWFRILPLLKLDLIHS